MNDSVSYDESSESFDEVNGFGAMPSLSSVYAEIMKRAPEHDFDPSLDRMRKVFDFLGHPENSMRIIHVTGTNGKGSTARMTEALCRSYGLRTGLYTSPHVESITERIAIDGQKLSDERFVQAWLDVKDCIDMVDRQSALDGGPHMSFFEILTTMAIWAFADAPVDVAIIEVGMGGRWDATNVVTADAAIIGPVDMDHMQWLGDSIADIATEKAGIIKPGSTVVVGPQPHSEVYDIIASAAREVGAVAVYRDGYETEVLSRVPAVGGQMVDLRTPYGEYSQIPLALFGEHQAHNALAALVAAEAVLPISGMLREDKVSQAFSSVRVPGRIEVIRRSPTIILDGGHNAHAVSALKEALEENFDFTHLVGVVSMMRDKDIEHVLGIMEPVLSRIIVTQNSWSSRVMPAEELEDIAVRVFGADRVMRADFMPDAIQTAVDEVDAHDELGVGYGHGIVVFGSFVTAGDARILLRERHDPDLKKAKKDRASRESAESELIPVASDSFEPDGIVQDDDESINYASDYIGDDGSVLKAVFDDDSQAFDDSAQTWESV